jgi:hypothetical protein
VRAEAVRTAHGARYAPTSAAVANTATRNLIVDDFRQFAYAEIGVDGGLTSGGDRMRR